MQNNQKQKKAENAKYAKGATLIKQAIHKKCKTWKTWKNYKKLQNIAKNPKLQNYKKRKK